MSVPTSPTDGFPWRTIARGILGLVFVVAFVCVPVAFALAYPHCTGARMTNCGMGPALLLYGSLLASGVALIVGALLLLLWQSQPMSGGLQLTCKLLTSASAIYLLAILVMVNL
jgi:hypothetical protein